MQRGADIVIAMISRVFFRVLVLFLLVDKVLYNDLKIDEFYNGTFKLCTLASGYITFVSA